ncbi:MAG: DNA polymerase III subunit alpha [Chloroflexi bacterium]|nr:DNA polymerase III subunit alpha [Chloroflexota bacterium]
MFTHLHVHTEFSLLDGLSRLEPLVAHAKDLGMNSLAITDHGGMYGAIDFYRIARKAGIKPIIGCEMYVASGSRHSRNPNEKSPYHMTVLAQNAQGYQNLVKLTSRSHLEGYYYKPRIDRELLEKYSDGIIVLSGCPSGEVPKAITNGAMDQAKETASWYRELLGERYFLELMSHGDVPELPEINSGIMELHRDLGIPVVATNDSHYTKREDASLQDILLCIQTNTNVNDANRMKMEEDSYYLRSPEEMAALWPEVPEAISNTQRIAEMCNLELDFTKLRLPQYPVPDGLNGDQYLRNICMEGLKRRLPNYGKAEEERLAYELDVIKYTQYPNYFLVVWDIAKFVREKDIFFAVRGSAAASLVLYCLGVTNVNPLTYTLVFERFLNVERKEMPDIDMDFQDDRREEVINYVVEKYGREHVAQIITFGTMGAKASVRDVGRALGMAYGDVDRVARLIPTRLHMTLQEAKETSPEFRELYDSDAEVKTLVDTAQGLEGVTRHSSTHAAGVVISEEPLDDVVPLQRPTKGNEDGVAMTQYTMEPCAALGLLKMDFLGLSNLSILVRARDLIAKTRGFQFDLTEIPLDDGKTFELLSNGDTVGVFQMEGAGMTRYIKELKPSSLADVAAMIALYRPGPMEHIDAFIKSKHGITKPNYPHPALKDILEETYGIIVYQDQVLKIVQTFAGYSLGEADIVRKAMGKKIPAIMAEEKGKFIDGALAQGYTREMAEQIFALIEPFAGYAFNKAHSVSYGLITYWTAYLKANFTPEYMVALLNSYRDNSEKVASAVAECRRLHIPVMLPNIDKGEVDYSIEEMEDGTPGIRFGLAAVKNVGTGAVEAIVNTRKKEGGFKSLEHMCQVADVGSLNRKTLESLMKAGAFDQYGDRNGLLEVIDRMLSLAQSEARMRDSNQTSMFEIMGESMPAEMVSIDVPALNTPDTDKSRWEQELLGVAISSNALVQLVAQSGDSESVVFLSDLNEDMAGNKVKVTGQISDVTRRYTRDNRQFTIATLALMDGSVEIFIWNEDMQGNELWEEGKLVTINGSVRVREDQISVSCSSVAEFIVPDVISNEEANDETQSDAVSGAAAAPAHGYGDAETDNPLRDTNGTGGAHIPDSTNGSNGANGSSGLPSTEMVQEPVQVTHRLGLRIRESGRPEDDKNLLVDLKNLLMDYQGKDEVMLEIATGGRIVTMEWPMVRVNACDELQERLQLVLGDSGTAYVTST